MAVGQIAGRAVVSTSIFFAAGWSFPAVDWNRAPHFFGCLDGLSNMCYKVNLLPDRLEQQTTKECFMLKKYVSMAVLSTVAVSASVQADEIYGGIGFPGITLGISRSIAPAVGLRGEYSGGLNLSRNGQRNGIDFNGNLKAQSVSVLADYFPMDNGFRVTGGLSFNSTRFTLNSTGLGATTINGKPVSLAGEFFNVEIKQPGVTPYIGIGYGFKPGSTSSWDFYADAGVMIGKFNSTTNTSIVGKQGITQADVDAQTATVRDNVSKTSVLPKVSLGASYRF